MKWYIDKDDDDMSAVANYSLQAPPLPDSPTNELNNEVVNCTIAENPHLFKIVTLIKVDVLESLLVSHPNQPFVRSVLKGLCEGFWPWADMHLDSYPVT
jgi:hypothetical protein